jgi:hypothetical protein
MRPDDIPPVLRNPLNRQVISDLFDETDRPVRALQRVAHLYAAAEARGVGPARLDRVRRALHRAARKLAAVLAPYPTDAVRGYLEAIRELSRPRAFGERMTLVMEGAIALAAEGDGGPLGDAARGMDALTRESLRAGR